MAAWGRTLRVLLATPLLAIGLLLAVGTFSEEGRAGGSTVLAQAKQHVAAVLHVSSETGAAGVAEVKADAAIAPVKASTTSGETGSAGTEEKAKSGSGESLGSALKRRVRRCAKQITGDDSPRKLEPTVRAKVMKCAQEFMPAMDTADLLKASEAKLLAAATTPQEKKDAMAAIAEVNDKPAAKADSAAPVKAVGGTGGAAAKGGKVAGKSV